MVENKMKILRIVFMGTPDFAVPTLQAMVQSPHEIVLTVTQPDRPVGRGRKLRPPPVKVAAQKLNLEVVQPVSIKTKAFIQQIKALQADLFVVIAFGQILPLPLLELPHLGSVNLHASLLPAYRGPAPIQWAIINGEKKSGVTAMLMDEGLDTGAILMSQSLVISSRDNAGNLHDRLAILSSELILPAMTMLADKNAKPQDHTKSSYAPLLKKADGHINWHQPADAIENFIRGMTPWPGAHTFYHKQRLKILQAESLFMMTQEPPGTVIKAFPDELRVASGQGALNILEIQKASGKRMLIRNFLQGHSLPPGTILC